MDCAESRKRLHSEKDKWCLCVKWNSVCHFRSNNRSLSMGLRDFQPNIRKEKTTTNLSVVPFQAWVFISNRSDTWQQRQQRQHLPLTAQSFPGGKSSLSRRSEPAVSFNRISQQKVRSTMSKLCTIGSGAGFDVSQSSGHILWRFCLLPPSSLWELIKHWTAWGQASAQSEKEKDFFVIILSSWLYVAWIISSVFVKKRLKDCSSVGVNNHQLLPKCYKHFFCFRFSDSSTTFTTFTTSTDISAAFISTLQMTIRLLSKVSHQLKFLLY